MSFIAAITRDKLLCTEIIEGAYDTTLFENVIFKMLESIRTNEETKYKTVLLFMDNAVFHKHSHIKNLCRRMKVNVLYNAQYSPWLNPVELLFGLVKRRLLKKQVHNKYLTIVLTFLL
jgi:transposase